MTTPVAAGPRRGTPVHYWLPIVVWLAIMLVLSSLPNPFPGLSAEVIDSLSDFALHAAGFVVLALLVLRLACFRSGGLGLRPLLWSLLACAAYGLFDEIHQIPIPGRAFAWDDWLADLAGAAIGLALRVVWTLLCRRVRQRRPAGSG